VRTLARLLHTPSALALPPDEYRRLRDEIRTAYGLDEFSPDVRAFVEQAAHEVTEERFETKEAPDATQD
jgi:hypothetical protein